MARRKNMDGISFEDAQNQFRREAPPTLEMLAGRRCTQCNKVMGFEIFLGPVCGVCCRINHRRVAGVA